MACPTKSAKGPVECFTSRFMYLHATNVHERFTRDDMGRYKGVGHHVHHRSHSCTGNSLCVYRKRKVTLHGLGGGRKREYFPRRFWPINRVRVDRKSYFYTAVLSRRGSTMTRAENQTPI